MTSSSVALTRKELFLRACRGEALPRVPVWMAVGAPFSVADLNESSANERLSQAMRDLGAALVEQFQLAPEDLPATPQHRKGREAWPNESK